MSKNKDSNEQRNEDLKVIDDNLDVAIDNLANKNQNISELLETMDKTEQDSAEVNSADAPTDKALEEAEVPAQGEAVDVQPNEE